MPIQEGRAEVPFYPDDLLPKMQQILAILADLGFQHEIQRDPLESWSEDQKVKDRLLADVDQCHRANREPLISCLEELRLKARSLNPATPRRADH
jgi:hypothetical protein